MSLDRNGWLAPLGHDGRHFTAPKAPKLPDPAPMPTKDEAATKAAADDAAAQVRALDRQRRGRASTVLHPLGAPIGGRTSVLGGGNAGAA